MREICSGEEEVVANQSSCKSSQRKRKKSPSANAPPASVRPGRPTRKVSKELMEGEFKLQRFYLQ